MLTQWDKLKAVQRMQDHIEDRLGERITLQSLARAAHYSPWHACRLFKEITGKPPFEYIRLRRLSSAAKRLRSTEQRVIDVALDFVFDSHEGFSRAFSRHFGIAPSRYRARNDDLELFLPPSARDWYMRRQRGAAVMPKESKDKQGKDPAAHHARLTTVFVQVMERPERTLIVKRGEEATHYFEYCEEVGCEVWETLGAIDGALHEPMGLWMPDTMRPEGTSTYVQGVEMPADYQGPVPGGFEIAELPACKMLVFQGPPFEDRDFEQAITSLWDVMKAYEPETYGFEWADEDGPRFQLRPEGYRGYIEGRPVRLLARREG